MPLKFVLILSPKADEWLVDKAARAIGLKMIDYYADSARMDEDDFN